ncbi:MAG: alpha/beta hydrolase [Clostridia bacterium]|nr:alpha/beta hydrolase [Clostridia bacterium]
MKKIQNVVYGDDPENHLLDIYVPDTPSFSTFIYFHGGGLENGDKSCGEAFAGYLADREIALVSVNYRMYPNAHYPDFIEDASRAVAWVFKNIENYGDCKKIYVGGSSAGAYLSMMLCFDNKYLGAYGINPLSISGWLHAAGQPTAHFNVLRERNIDSRRIIVDDSAPIYHVEIQKSYSPMTFIVSDNDIIGRYEQTMLMLATLKHFGCNEDKTKLITMNGTHCAYVQAFDCEGHSVFGNIIYNLINENF